MNIPVTDSAPAVANGATATPAAATATATTTRSYTVRAGDTLSRIAQREGTTVAALRSANRLTSDNIRVGQELVIPVTGAPAPTAAVTTTPSATAQLAATGSNLTYVVQPGDSPTTIARQLGVEVNELMRANNITDPRRLRVGQTLVVPGRTQPATQAAASPSPTAARPAQTTPTQMVPQASRPATLPAGNRQPSPLDLLEDEDNLPVIDFVEVDE
ncbi:MAG: LysM peptidoglycan-binding domain-containing protein [Verrucomicrobia bacterium]|nr:LysM peptidoglycan-binding domain-containing protein [Verrucomicrobiota bacterium]